MACDQSYFRQLSPRQKHVSERLYDWPFAANRQVTNNKPFLLINLGPFRAKPAERGKTKAIHLTQHPYYSQ